MPELPEVEALVIFLREKLADRAIASIDVASISVLKTYDPPPTALAGMFVVRSHSTRKVPRHRCRRSAHHHPPLSCRVVALARLAHHYASETGQGADLVSGASRRRLGVRPHRSGYQEELAVYIVDDPQSVPGIARLGPIHWREEFDIAAFREVLDAHGRTQLKGLLRDQSVIAGVGNAYSDEILHVAKLSPFKAAGTLDDETSERLYHAMVDTLRDATARSAGTASVGAERRQARRNASARAKGQECPECGDVVREVSFADSSLQYCATCQTGGKPLADRRLSKLLK